MSQTTEAIKELQGIWTQYGRDRVANWLSGGEPLTMTYAAVGAGGGDIPEVKPSQEALVEEVWRGQLNSVLQNPEDPTDVIVDLVLPNDVGGFWIREWGIFDNQGKLVAVGPHDEMHKPKIESGQAAEFLIRIHLPVADAGAITLMISSQALSTHAYVESKIKEHNEDTGAHNLPDFVKKTQKISTAGSLKGGGTLSGNLNLSLAEDTAPTANNLILRDAAGRGKVNAPEEADDIARKQEVDTAARTAQWAQVSGKPSSFAPAGHKITHATGGTDALTPADIGAAAAVHKNNHKTGGTDAITPADIGAAPTSHTTPLATDSATGHVKPGTGLSVDAAGALAVKYGTAAGTAAQGNDSRLSNARTPTAHKATHATGGTDALTPADIGAAAAVHKNNHKTGGTDAITPADIGAAAASHATPLATASATGHVKPGTGLSVDAAGALAVKYGTAAGTAAQGNDSRLSNARTPTAHKATHATGGTDAITPADIGAAATSHTTPLATASATGHVKPGTGLSVDAAGALAVKYGTAAGTAAQGNDSRLSNARTPTAHKATHATGGTDALTAADLGFTQSLAASGWQKLPSGLIIQWGSNTTLIDNVFVTYTLPLAFPAACVAVVAMPYEDKAWVNEEVKSAIGRVVSKSQIALGLAANASKGVGGVYWIALGY